MKLLNDIIKKTPILREFIPFLKKMRGDRIFPGTASYWEERYKSGGNSGLGSYSRLAEFKARVINEFIAENTVNSAIEFGCGYGNNLGLINYPKYIGLDIAPTSISICINKYEQDSSKSFYLYN